MVLFFFGLPWFTPCFFQLQIKSFSFHCHTLDVGMAFAMCGGPSQVVARHYAKLMLKTAENEETIQTGHRLNKENKVPRKV